jgi:hypothetical protein
MECKLHPGVQMKQMWKKDDPNHLGDSWHSHKLDDGTWCNGKPKSTHQFQNNPQREELIGKVLASLNTKQDKIIAMLESIGGRLPVEVAKMDKSKELPF